MDMMDVHHVVGEAWPDSGQYRCANARVRTSVSP